MDVTYQEEPSLLPEIKKDLKEEESSNASSGAPHQSQRRRSHESNKNRSCVPENVQQDHVTEPTHERETMLVKIVSGLRTVREEYRQLRIRMEGIDVHQIEALKKERAQITTAITARQDNMAGRFGRIEGHTNNIGRGQNHALESNQALWKGIQEHKDRLDEMHGRTREGNWYLTSGVP